MALKVKTPDFDNLDDVLGKFVNTMCYYEGKAINIKNAHFQEDGMGGYIKGKFLLTVSVFNGKNKLIKLEDPAFNYKHYNLGYANNAKYCVWWYRKPVKQYKQGLRQEQMSYVMSDPYLMPEENFNFSRPYVDMMENNYPSMDIIEQALRTGQCKMKAFHRDFALSWDEIHEDFVLEHRGNKVGVSINNKLTEFKLMADYRHLAESLQEALA